MMKICSMIIGAALLLGCAFRDVTPEKTWDADARICSADLKDGQLAFLTESAVEIIPIGGGMSAEKHCSIPVNENNVLFVNGATSWIGGGGLGNGLIYKLNTSTCTLDALKSKDVFSQVCSLAYGMCQDLLVSGHANGEIIVWDGKSGHKRQSFGDYKAEIFATEVSQNRCQLYSGDAVGVIDLWDLASTSKLRSSSIDGSVFTLRYDGTGDKILAGGGKGVLYVFDGDLSNRRSFQVNNEAILSADWYANGTKVICGLTNGYVATVDITTRASKVLRLHKDDILGVRILAGGRKVLTTSRDGVTNLWKAAVLE
jgi:WD40 repeat protein